jgi:antitoxin VapB
MPLKSLNIKDPEAHRLAAAIARETGETLTSAVTESLRERFARLPAHGQKASFEELRAISVRAASRLKNPYVEHGDLLYDEHGLPK